jgi:hypothetical protein
VTKRWRGLPRGRRCAEDWDASSPRQWVDATTRVFVTTKRRHRRRFPSLGARALMFAVVAAAMLTATHAALGKPRVALAAAGSAVEGDYQGFDICTTPTVGQMWDFFDGTPYYVANIYFAGKSRAGASSGCYPDTNLNAAWVLDVAECNDSAECMHYDLIPTYVGAQAPYPNCDTVGGFGEYMSTNLTTAYNQGQTDGDDAYNHATTLGFQGGAIYLDIEPYTAGGTQGGNSCEKIVESYIEGFIDILRYAYSVPVGVYANPSDPMIDYSGLGGDVPNDIWTADFGGEGNVWGITGIPNTAWVDDQRISQWNRNKYNKQNGLTLNIDNDCALGQVAFTNNGEPDSQDPTGENGGSSGEDPACNGLFTG